MSNTPTPRSFELKSLQLHKMPTAQSWEFNQFDVERLNEYHVRAHVSKLNREFGINLKCHKTADKRLLIWHDPTPRVVKPISPLFEQLLETQKEHDVLKEEIKRKMAAVPQINANDDLTKYGELEDKIAEIVAQLKQQQEAWTHKNSGGRITQPLEVILNRLKITKEIWDLQTGYQKTRRWIAEEVKIKAERMAQQ